MDIGPNKAIAAGAGSGLGGAVAILILALFWPDANAAVTGAMTTVCSTVVAIGATYLTPHGA